MNQTNVIKMVPMGCSDVVVQALRVKGIWAHRRGRGPRPNVKRWTGANCYQAYLPLDMSTHCTIYLTDHGDHTCRKTYWDFLGWDADRQKPKLKFNG